jgi:tetratricopeptide (TPR) repeat protein
MLLRLLAFTFVVLSFPAGCLGQDPPEYSQAAQLVQQQRWAEALKLIRALQQQYPGNPKVENLKGLALLGSGDTKSALVAFEHVVAARPDFFPALKNLAILEWEWNRPSATAHTDQALKLRPPDPVLNAYAVFSDLQKKDTAAVNQHLEKASDAISALPPELEMRMGTQMGKAGLYPQAVKLFQSLMARAGNSPNLSYNLGLAQSLAGDDQGAISTLESDRSRKPSSDGLNLLAQVYEKTNQTQLAIDRLREATSLYPTDENNYLDLATICIDHNAFPLGIEVVEVGLKNKPGSQKLLIQLGLLHALSGRFDEARVEFDQANKQAPSRDLPIAAVELANIQQSRFGEAVHDLRKKVKQNGNSAILWYLLGKAVIINGAAPGRPEFTEAQSAFQEAIRLDPKLPYSYIELGKIYFQLGRTEESVPLFEKGIALAPQEPSSYYRLAMAYKKLNQTERANQMLDRLKEMNRRTREFEQSGLSKPQV